MKRTDALVLVGWGSGAAAETPQAVGYWFAFTYSPPALLAGREARAS